MKSNCIGLIMLLAAFIWPGMAAAAGDIEAGQARAGTCVACHGASGQSEIPATPGMVVPNIGGQYADYLVKALKDYRSGARKNAGMTSMAAGLSDQDIEHLAAYYASLIGLSVVKQP
jgi:cytochrome c553